MKFSKETTLKLLTFVIGAFLLVRLALNLPYILLPLNLFFVSSYLLLFALFRKKSPWFLPLIAVFLAVDSMIGTYFFSIGKIEQVEYFGTMAVNIGILLTTIYHERSSY